MAWIFLNNAMISIVENRNDPSSVVVRARVRGDLEAIFEGYEVIEGKDGDGSDYRFRLFLDKEYVAERIKDIILDINYDNFKNSIPYSDRDRKYSYGDVWGIMASLQRKYFPNSLY